jgi:hypothetical protein
MKQLVGMATAYSLEAQVLGAECKNQQKAQGD